MAIASVVVEIEQGAGEAVLAGMARMRNVSVYGMKENQIVAVIEGDSSGALEEGVKALAALDWVVGVYPVMTGEYE